MESFPKVLITPYMKWKPSDLDYYIQWEDYDNDMSFGANIFATKITQSNDVLKLILSAPQ